MDIDSTYPPEAAWSGCSTPEGLFQMERSALGQLYFGSTSGIYRLTPVRRVGVTDRVGRHKFEGVIQGK
ncbi:hypothetical protein [Nocardia carnea]|uniref:hypothetical protein n=1 Tax=Nocardia carnea TaxID=37328 RepID=UPI002453EC9A|nr:hypothetical protein [Nocardia carnea]